MKPKHIAGQDHSRARHAGLSATSLVEGKPRDFPHPPRGTVAVGSGNPCDPASFRKPERRTFQGRCLAILRPAGRPGKITLKAQAEGLAPATLTVRAR